MKSQPKKEIPNKDLKIAHGNSSKHSSAKSSGRAAPMSNRDKEAATKKEENDKQMIKAKQIYLGLDDLARLPELNEDELLLAMETRFKSNKIFSFVGPNLAVVNPFKMIDSLFSTEKLKLFQDALKRNINPATLEPHIFGVAALAMQQAREGKKKQAIVISGESGAGKTENTKFAISFLTQIQSSESRKDLFSDESNINIRDSWARVSYRSQLSIEQRILACNPILESFGNAKTVRNDNSSRFGKLIKLNLKVIESSQQGSVKGSSLGIQSGSIQSYLLEKSRIVKISGDERNYHAFYQLIQGLDLNVLEQLGLPWKSSGAYRYLRSKVETANGIDDSEWFMQVNNCFEELGFTESEKNSVWEILASILLLGNIDFEQSNENQPAVILRSQKTLADSVCKRLQCSQEALLMALTTKTIQVGTSILVSPITIQECNQNRDSLSKYLYDRLFSWLVFKLNHFIGGSNTPASDQPHNQITNVIEILDIFGFEAFDKNGFEQLCINFANERLQQLYISYIFRGESLLFASEGLSNYLSEIKFSDNQPIIQSLEFTKEPIGVFNLLDEASAIKSADDQTFLASVLKQHFQKTKTKSNINNIDTNASPGIISFSPLQQQQFTVKHSIGQVVYSVDGFRNKNKDEVSLQIQLLSQHKTIKSIIHFDKDNKEIPEENINRNTRDSSNAVVNKSNDKFISSKFRSQMKQLMEELSGCECQFVRCVKPNMQKQPLFFTKNYVLNQVNCLGLLETIRVRKEGYLYRADYMKFLQSFSLLAMTQNLTSQDQAKLQDIAVQLITKAGILKSQNDLSVLFGKTMIFLKETAYDALTQQLKRKEIELKAAGLVIAKAYRCYQIRSWLKKIKKVRRFLICLLYRFRFVKSDVVSKMREARKLKEKELKQHKSIIAIRKLFQVLIMKRRLKRLSAARRIQLWYINRKRQEFIKKKLAITKKYIKSKLQMIKDRKAYLKIRNSITTIQRAFRRAKFRREIHARVMVLSVLNRAIDETWDKILNAAATKINSVVRMYICKCSNYEIVLQSRAIGAITKKISSAKKIQYTWRYYQFRQAMGGYRTAAETIQSYYKMIEHRQRYRNVKQAASIIQAQVRNYLYTKQYLLKQWAEYSWDTVFESEIERENGLAMLNIPYFRRRRTNLMSKLCKEKMQMYQNQKEQSNMQYSQRNKNRNNNLVCDNISEQNEQFIIEKFISIDEEEDDQKVLDNLEFSKNKLNYQRQKIGQVEKPCRIKEYSICLSEDICQLKVNNSRYGNSSNISSQNVPIFSDFQENHIYYRLFDEKVKLHCVILDLDEIDGCSNEIYSQESWSESYLKSTRIANKRGTVVTTILVGESYTALVTDNSQIFTFGKLLECDSDKQQVNCQQRNDKQQQKGEEDSAFIKYSQLSPIQGLYSQSVQQTPQVLTNPNYQSQPHSYQYQTSNQENSLSLSLQDALISLKTNLHSTKAQPKRDEKIIERNVSLFSPGIVRRSPQKIPQEERYFSNQKDNVIINGNGSNKNQKQSQQQYYSQPAITSSLGSAVVNQYIGCIQVHDQLKQIIRCDSCCDSMYFQTNKNGEWHILGENHLDLKVQQQDINRQKSPQLVFADPTSMDQIQFSSIHQQASTHSTIIVEKQNNNNNTSNSLNTESQKNNQTEWICEIQSQNQQGSVNRFHFNQSISQVTCGGSFSLFLNYQGLVYAFGENLGGQLGLSHNVSPINKPILIPFFAEKGEAIRSVSAGLKHSLAVSDRGKLFAWGSNQVGQLGLGHFQSVNIPTQVENKGPCAFVCARAGLKSSIALTQYRQLIMWGTNSCVNKQPLPQEISLEKYAKDIDHAKRNWAIVKLGSTWSKNLSIFYAIVVDMAGAKNSMRQSLLKQAQILARDWQQHEVTPPGSLRLLRETNKLWRDKNE